MGNKLKSKRHRMWLGGAIALTRFVIVLIQTTWLSMNTVWTFIREWMTARH